MVGFLGAESALRQLQGRGLGVELSHEHSRLFGYVVPGARVKLPPEQQSPIKSHRPASIGWVLRLSSWRGLKMAPHSLHWQACILKSTPRNSVQHLPPYQKGITGLSLKTAISGSTCFVFRENDCSQHQVSSEDCGNNSFSTSFQFNKQILTLEIALLLWIYFLLLHYLLFYPERLGVRQLGRQTDRQGHDQVIKVLSFQDVTSLDSMNFM